MWQIALTLWLPLSLAIVEVDRAPLQLPLPQPQQFTPTYPSFNSQRLDQQVRLYSNYLAAGGAPDVLIVGSSRSLQGVDPIALQQALAARGYPGLRVYNFSINGATAKVIDLVLRQILPADQLPQMIIWADGSRAFNSGRLDVTYNGIAASEGYKRLAMGGRPISRPTEIDLPPIAPVICQDAPIPTAVGKRSPVEWVSLPYCEPPQAPVRLPLSGRGLEETVATDLNAYGFQAVATQFNPVTYYRQFPRVSGRYDSSYVPFQLGGEQMNATIAVANFARTQQVPLVFVNLPLTQEYLDPIRQGYEQQFRQHMQQLATREGFIFRDLMQQWATRNDYFADPSHLNQFGARAVSQALALDAAIPWNILHGDRNALPSF